jgi:hypothetical protein
MILILDERETSKSGKAPRKSWQGASAGCLLILATFFSSGASSQPRIPTPATPPPVGQPQANTESSERPVTDSRQVDPGQLNILPNVGNAGRSAAPTMAFDCQKNPGSCTLPATPQDKAADPPDTSTAPVTAPAPPKR